jgi:hypothetical protein
MVLCAAVVGDHAKTGVVALLRQAVMIINGFPVLPRQAIMTKGGTFTLQGDDPLPTPVRPAVCCGHNSTTAAVKGRGLLAHRGANTILVCDHEAHKHAILAWQPKHLAVVRSENVTRRMQTTFL